MGNTREIAWRSQLIFGSLLLMVLAVFVSRALLSISMILFLAATLLHKKIGEHARCFLKQPVYVAVSFLFLIPLISGLWSEDHGRWLSLLRIKLPLLLFPMAFAGPWRLSGQKWLIVALFFIGTTVLGSAWSLSAFLSHPEIIASAYLKAKSLPTPLENDHVRFSWMVSCALLCCIISFKESASGIIRISLVVAAILLIFYLHVLAARTGLISFYLSLAGLLIYLLKKHAHFASVAGFMAIFCVFPLLAWKFLPTFQNRLHYMVYDLSNVKSSTYIPGSNDGARVLSLRAGWSILSSHPLGIGAGDIVKAEEQWYQTHVPGMVESDKFFPCSEWLMYGDMAGWPGFIILTGILCVPFLYRPRRYQLLWILLHATAAFSFLFDIGLEVQYGVFLYAFIILWWFKWFHPSNSDI